MIAGYTLYQIAWYFLVYSFLGWGLEVVYCTVTSGKVVNRGFLNGPVCPIYGFGMLAVLMLLGPLVQSQTPTASLLLFLGGMLLTSAVELFGGWAMLKLFHARWWDYRDRPFNIGGFICLQFSLAWGLGVLVACRVIHPLVHSLTAGLLPPAVGVWLLAVLYAVYAADTAASALTMVHLNRDLAELEKLADRLEALSERMSTDLGTKALQADQKLDESRLQAKLAGYEARDAAENALDRLQDAAEDAAARLKDAAAETLSDAEDAVIRLADDMAESRFALEARVEALRANVLGKRFGGRRLLRAFPQLDPEKGRAQLEALRKELAHWHREV